jgi:hypothetical protein
VFGIVHSDESRNQAGRSWIAKALIYTLASTLGGATAGAALGFAGQFLSDTVRVAGATGLGVLAAVVGAVELAQIRLRPLQCDRETPQRWMDTGALRWAARNGWVLGIGATSRIGFWLWYILPLSALLLGTPLLGALIYGLYGFVRGAAVWPLILGARQRRGIDFNLWLLHKHPGARTLAAADLLLVGLAVILAVGI